MKINWLAAQQEYVADTTLSYVDIANKYGVSDRAVANVAKKYNWVAARQATTAKVREKLQDSVSDTIVEFQAEKLKVGKFLIGVGVQGITEHKPRTARESREVLDSGYKIATEAMGLNKPGTTVNIQNNQTNVMGMTDFVAAIKQRRNERAAVVPNEQEAQP